MLGQPVGVSIVIWPDLSYNTSLAIFPASHGKCVKKGKESIYKSRYKKQKHQCALYNRMLFGGRMRPEISIDDLIKIVKKGGRIKTGINIHNKDGVLLLEKNVLVSDAKILEIIKKEGLSVLPLNPENNGGIWGPDGKLISTGNHPGYPKLKPNLSQKKSPDHGKKPAPTGEIEKRLKRIEEIKNAALVKYNKAKQSVKKVLDDIKNTGGVFDYNEVENNVSELVDFLTLSENPFSYLTREIFSYDDYLYSHSVNVCAIGTAVLNRFNDNFSSMIDTQLNQTSKGIYNAFAGENTRKDVYKYYLKEDLTNISIGYFLHDIGKVLIPDKILNKQGKLTSMEFDVVKTHSYKLGPEILDKNDLKTPFVRNVVRYHHSQLYEGENRCYPDEKTPVDIHLYVKICKLADIYDAMTSKRCYKEAFNQISVVTDIFRQYAKKDKILQYILHSFVQTVGIYPTGSILSLRNGQLAYVLESDGPLVLPFTDTNEDPLLSSAEPINLKEPDIDEQFKVDNRKPIKKPLELVELLPSYLKF